MKLIKIEIIKLKLEAMILKALHISDGRINLCHQANLDKPYEDYKDELHVLTYDMTDGDHFADEADAPVYEPTQLQMGLRPIKITNVNLSQDYEDKIFVNGKNFNNACRVYVNDSKVSTSYIDESTLLIDGVELKDGDVVSVHLVDSKELEFFETDSIEYHQDVMEQGREKEEKSKKKSSDKNK